MYPLQSIYAGVCMVRIGLRLEVEESCEISFCTEKSNFCDFFLPENLRCALSESFRFSFWYIFWSVAEPSGVDRDDVQVG